uniref:Receptor-type tyrosine-protein phosphatase H n=1 Tax=Magallana gigas TaxID=29159 RepID=K1PWV4_MAGGI
MTKKLNELAEIPDSEIKFVDILLPVQMLKVKCNKYWPDKDNPALYGPVQVMLMEEKEYACFTTRQLSVLHKKLKCTRVVTQYHYTAWPDHGVPEPLCLLSFHSHVITTSANNSQSPTIEQYITIYLALNEVFKAPVKLDTMVEFLNKTEKARKNTQKISFPEKFYLVMKKYGLYFSPNKTTRNNYINAIAVPSFTNLQHFIVTKYPLEENALDLLRLLSDHESDTVISMQPLSGIKSLKYSVLEVLLTRPSFEVWYRRSFIWKQNNQYYSEQVIDGASLCGLFIAVHNVIQQMNMDDRVDVFTAVRQLQIRRPEFCARFEDYETIYQAVMDHYQNASENIYYNQ